jgi:hypothetical protein
MQISASTLLASQQVGQTHAKAAPAFTQALEKASSSFQPLPLKQAGPAQDAPTNFLQPAPKGSPKPGSTIDIKV